MNNLNLVDVPFTRVPVCLALDTSGSMAGEKIKELNKGIKVFYDAVMSCEEAKFAVDLNIVSFGKDGVKTLLEFDMITNQTLPQLTADNLTPLGEGIKTSLLNLDRRKNEYKQNGNDYYQPWLIIMTDGWPTDDYENVAFDTRQRVLNGKLSVFPIAIGEADTNVIEEFSPKRKCLRLKGLNFVEFFEWLSKSVISLSQSSTDEDVNLDPSFSTWAKL